MLRRLYMLFPARSSVEQAVDELEAMGVKRKYLHTIAHQNVDIRGLPEATVRQKGDYSARLETLLWNTNLAVFFVALVVFVASLFALNPVAIYISLVVLIVSFSIGHYFTHHVPHTHLEECRTAMQHGEILLLVDVPRWRITEVRRAVKAHHPDMEMGGVSWTMDGL